MHAFLDLAYRRVLHFVIYRLPVFLSRLKILSYDEFSESDLTNGGWYFDMSQHFFAAIAHV